MRCPTPSIESRDGPARAAKTWNRKEADLKEIIEQLALILDKKPVHWTQRVGRVVGRNRPSGQITEFLGTDTVQALWPDASGHQSS